MPNHCRVWNRDTYHKIRGHSRHISVADDYELIVKTFLETKFEGGRHQNRVEKIPMC